MSSPLYAHTPNDADEWHWLDKHSTDVASAAAANAGVFGSGEHAALAEALARWAGLWHDLGKAWPKFQEYLLACERAKREGRKSPASPGPHAIWGALLVYNVLRKHAKQDWWREVATPIAGHHAGLKAPDLLAQELEAELENADLSRFLDVARTLPSPPRISGPILPKHRRELFIRMLLSALADADYLDTERHFDEKRAERRSGFTSIPALWTELERNQNELLERAARKPSTVNNVRREVYDACLSKATGQPGFFRLTVPTGGGKTRSALAFALKHAEVHELRRVVAAIPYTSIIDQTAQVYESIFGEGEVVVHHSRVPVPNGKEEAQDVAAVRLRLATENWDAPLVLTTTVQLFESLFARHPSRVRKLHRLAQSVILLDEVQALPPGVLIPTLDVLRTLVEDYGVTVVFSTATQPAFEQAEGLTPLHGVEVREIVEDYPHHFDVLDRVYYEVPPKRKGWETLADEVADEEQVMVVLNTRRDALALLKELEARGTPNLFHLSTLLCSAHRNAVLAEITRRLDPKRTQQVRLISTQVVEAGMDFDFPTVYRATGPLDRIVQAAGRCNREGRLGRHGGRVVVFRPAEGGTPQGPYRAGLGLARKFLADGRNLHDSVTYTDYFARLYDGRETPLDARDVQTYREELNYPEVEDRYRLIPEDTVPIVVISYGEGDVRLTVWRERPSRRAWQRLQPYVVNVFEHQLRALGRGIHLEELSDGLFAWHGRYDDLRGLPPALDDPADLTYRAGDLIVGG